MWVANISVGRKTDNFLKLLVEKTPPVYQSLFCWRNLSNDLKYIGVDVKNGALPLLQVLDNTKFANILITKRPIPWFSSAEL